MHIAQFYGSVVPGHTKRCRLLWHQNSLRARHSCTCWDALPLHALAYCWKWSSLLSSYGNWRGSKVTKGWPLTSHRLLGNGRWLVCTGEVMCLRVDCINTNCALEEWKFVCIVTNLITGWQQSLCAVTSHRASLTSKLNLVRVLAPYLKRMITVFGCDRGKFECAQELQLMKSE